MGRLSQTRRLVRRCSVRLTPRKESERWPLNITYQISVDDFDKSLLPPHAQTPGTDEFKTEVSRALEREYAEFGGWVQIVVNEQTIQVTWKSDPTRPNPLDVVDRKKNAGDLVGAVRTLEHLRRHEPNNIGVLCNLGMALSDLGQLAQAQEHLRHVLALEPNQITAQVALGVVLLRQGDLAEAIRELRRAVRIAPSHPWAQQNLAGMLFLAGDFAEAELHYRKAVELRPADQQFKLDFAKCLLRLGKTAEADAVFGQVIEIDANSSVAEAAREERTTLAQENFRVGAPDDVQPDAVMYCLGAIKKFDKMKREEVEKIGFEIAILGQQGLDTSDAKTKYRLKSMPGEFTGLQLICTMFVAFKILSPEQGMGFDLDREYEVAKRLQRDGEVGE